MTKRTRKAIPEKLRAAVNARDGHVCVYCGEKRHAETCRHCEGADMPMTLDHVVPHSLGGADTAANLVTACGCCNRVRATFPVDLFAELLRREGRPGAEARVLVAISTPLPKK